jgi:hypothetical protein
MIKALLAICLILVVPVLSSAQDKDSLIVKDAAGTVVAKDSVVPAAKTDTSKERVFSPRKAALYSAILPGLGQVYNKKYWKVPIVYAAVGIPVYLFFDNKNWYNRTRYALAVLNSTTYPNNSGDSLSKVHPQLRGLVERKADGALQNYRNEFRKNMDYSILFTLLFWGLNVVDATVDAHLKGFNVSDNLSLKIKPTILSTQSVGLSLVLSFNDSQPKTIPSLR